MDKMVEKFLKEKGLLEEFEKFVEENALNIEISGKLMYGDGDGWHDLGEYVFTKEDWNKYVEWAKAYTKQFDSSVGVIPFGTFEGTSGALCVNDILGKSSYNKITIKSSDEVPLQLKWDYPVEVLKELIDSADGTGWWDWQKISEKANDLQESIENWVFHIYAAYYFATGKLVEMPDADWI